RGGRETLNDVFDFVRCQLTRRGRTGKAQGHWAGGNRGVPEHERVRLAPRMIQLHPDRDTGVLRGFGPERQRIEVALVLDDDIARLAQLRAIDHDIAGDDQTVPASAPARIQPLEAAIRGVALVAESFAQRGLHDPIGQHLATGQGQWVVQGGHKDCPFMSLMAGLSRAGLNGPMNRPSSAVLWNWTALADGTIRVAMPSKI